MCLLTPTTVELRRQLEALQDQLFLMRASRRHLEAETRMMSTMPYTQGLYSRYKILLTRRKVMASEISRVEVELREKREDVEVSLQEDFKKRFKRERKDEFAEKKGEGVVGKLGRIFRRK